MVYAPEDGQQVSMYSPGPTWVNFVCQTNAANHYATPPTKMPTKCKSASVYICTAQINQVTMRELGFVLFYSVGDSRQCKR